MNGGSAFGICTVAASCFAGSTGGLGGEMNNPSGVATDRAGDVYVVDAGGARIQEFDSSGNWLRAFGGDVGGSGGDICTVAASCQVGSTGGLGGEMYFPQGVATDAAGNLYVADFGNNRIQKFQDPYQPDAQVKLASDTSYLGVGIINTTGAGQTRTTTARGKSATFDLRFVNAGTHSDAIAVKGCTSSSNFTVQYFKGTTDVTASVTAGTYKTGTLPAGASQVLKLKIAVSSTATAGKIDTCAVTASSKAAPPRKDVVKAKVKAG